MSYQDKYLKYKKKYIDLKKELAGGQIKDFQPIIEKLKNLVDADPSGNKTEILKNINELKQLNENTELSGKIDEIEKQIKDLQNFKDTVVPAIRELISMLVIRQPYSPYGLIVR